MTTVLLTGFEPFDGANHNSSWDAVKLVAEGWDASAFLVTSCLPVEFGEAGSMLAELVSMHAPDLVIATGVAGGRTRVTPERIAINLQDARIPDNAGVQPIDIPVIESAPDAYFTRLPIAEMVSRMTAAGIPSSVSLSAGTYVCNDLMYRMLHELAGRELLAGFIHVPDSADLSIESSAAGLRIAIAVGLDAMAPRKLGRVGLSGTY